MAQVNLTKTSASSFLQGLGKRGNTQTGQIVIPTFSLAGSALSSVFEASIMAPAAELAAITMAKSTGVVGSVYNAQWFPLAGSVEFFGGANYAMLLYTVRSGTTYTVRARFKNTQAFAVTIPNITVDFKTIFFDAPW